DLFPKAIGTSTCQLTIISMQAVPKAVRFEYIIIGARIFKMVTDNTKCMLTKFHWEWRSNYDKYTTLFQNKAFCLIGETWMMTKHVI
ncbi:hypothetical protein ACJX0J_038578, partial [Zea mays]